MCFLARWPRCLAISVTPSRPGRSSSSALSLRKLAYQAHTVVVTSSDQPNRQPGRFQGERCLKGKLQPGAGNSGRWLAYLLGRGYRDHLLEKRGRGLPVPDLGTSEVPNLSVRSRNRDYLPEAEQRHLSSAVLG